MRLMRMALAVAALGYAMWLGCEVFREAETMVPEAVGFKLLLAILVAAVGVALPKDMAA